MSLSSAESNEWHCLFLKHGVSESDARTSIETARKEFGEVAPGHWGAYDGVMKTMLDNFEPMEPMIAKDRRPDNF